MKSHTSVTHQTTPIAHGDSGPLPMVTRASHRRLAVLTALTVAAVVAGGFGLWRTARVDTTKGVSVTTSRAAAAAPAGIAVSRPGADMEWVHIYLVGSAEDEASARGHVAEADELRAGLGESPLKVTIFRATSPVEEAQARDAITHLDHVRAAAGLPGVRVDDLRTHPSAAIVPH